jgi:hypothetical protein
MGTAMNRPVTTSGRFVAPDPGHFPSSAVISKNRILDEDEETRDNVCLWVFRPMVPNLFTSMIPNFCTLNVLWTRFVRLGTASMMSEPGGAFINLDKINVNKYAQRPAMCKVRRIRRSRVHARKHDNSHQLRARARGFCGGGIVERKNKQTIQVSRPAANVHKTNHQSPNTPRHRPWQTISCTWSTTRKRPSSCALQLHKRQTSRTGGGRLAWARPTTSWGCTGKRRGSSLPR